MGSVMSGIFGGGYQAPETPEIPSQPAYEAEKEPVAKAARDAERRKIAARAGASRNILTSPLGTQGAQKASGRLGVLGGDR